MYGAKNESIVPVVPPSRVDGVDPLGTAKPIQVYQSAREPGDQSAGASLNARARERSTVTETTTRGRRARLSLVSFGDGTTREGFVAFVGSGRERVCRDDGPGARTRPSNHRLNDELIDHREIVEACFHASIRVDLYFYASGIPANRRARRRLLDRWFYR